MSPPGQAVGGWECDIRGPKCPLPRYLGRQPCQRSRATNPSRTHRAGCLCITQCQNGCFAHTAFGQYQHRPACSMFMYESLRVDFPKMLIFHFIPFSIPANPQLIPLWYLCAASPLCFRRVASPSWRRLFCPDAARAIGSRRREASLDVWLS